MNNQNIAYDLEDLAKWHEGSSILTPPATLSVFGDPVKHSLSPHMHNPALHNCGIDGQYVKIRVPEVKFKETLSAIYNLGFKGTNCTIPLKFAALNACDHIDSTAKRMGAVNTISFENGKVIGSNSDGPGLVRAIREEFSIDIRDLRVMILGAGGGAGRAVAIQCAMEKVERLVLVNRTKEKAEKLSHELSSDLMDESIHKDSSRLKVTEWSEEGLESEISDIDLIINASSLGMKNSDPELVSQNLLKPHHLIYDMIYSPSKTRLIRNAKSVGARTANGLSMLLHQGAISFETWFNQEAPVEVMRKGLKDAIELESN
tara:strand:+ start:8516 stop:9466 length:951 start_codon:yes stop_codon:yes gene_type:complete